MSTLLLTPYTPLLDTGRGLRTYGIVAALARSGEVEVAYRPFGGSAPAPQYGKLANVKLTRLEDGRRARRAMAYLGSRARGTLAGVARGITPALVAAGRQAGDDVDVIADGVVSAAALLGVARHRPVVYCAHNLESGFRHTLPGEATSAAAMARFERTLLDAAAESWMVSEADAEGARALCPGARIKVVPNVVDVRAITPVSPEPGAQRVLFVADLTYTPNREALRFLRDEVRPRLRELVPDAIFAIVGRGAEAADEADGLRILGRVEDLAAEYAAAAVVVVPLLQGGGSPLKFVEALAYGLPVVATPKAAAGLDVEVGTHYLEAATADEFAASITRVLNGDAGELGVAGRRLAAERYSIEYLANLLRQRSSAA